MVARLPGVVYAQLPRAATGTHARTLDQPPRLVVVHDTSNSASKEAEARYAATRTDLASAWTSAHFYADTGGVLGSTPLTVQAWAAFSYANGHGWHIEMCGYNTGDSRGPVPRTTIQNTAGLVRQLCDLAEIPLVKLSPADLAAGKRGICGHRDITIGLGVGDHDDPGPGFDWTAFIAAVNRKDEDDMTPAQQYVQHVMNYRLDAIIHMRPTNNVPVFTATDGTVYNAFTEVNQLAAAILAAGGSADPPASSTPPPDLAALVDMTADEVAKREAAALRAQAAQLEA